MGFFSKEPKEKRTLEDILSVKEDVVESKDEEDLFEDDIAEEAETKEEQVEPLNPLDCFFIRGENSEKWLVKLAKIWNYVISVVWFFIGALTFAPVLYLTYKTNLIFKNKKKAVVCGIVIYVLIISLITFLIMR